VPADDHDLIRTHTAALGRDDVDRRACFVHGLDQQTNAQPTALRGLEKLQTVLLRDRHRGDVGTLLQRPGGDARLVVVDDDGDGAPGGRVGDLFTEGDGAPLDQRDRADQPTPLVVLGPAEPGRDDFGFSPAGRGRGREEEDLGGHGPRGGACDLHLHLPGLEERKLERMELDGVAVLPQLRGQILRRLPLRCGARHAWSDDAGQMLHMREC